MGNLPNSYISNITNLGDFEVITIANSQNGEFFSIIPALGGLLLDVAFLFNGSVKSILDTYETGEDAKQNVGRNFKGTKLAPFPNRIRGGAFEFKGKTYQLPVNFPQENNAIHGWIFDKKFTVNQIEIDDECACLSLSYTHKPFDSFPFSFTLKQDYKLSEGNLIISTEVQNTGSTPMPYGDGWHPYFKTGSKVDTIEAMFDTKEQFKVDASMIPTGETIPYNAFKELKKLKETSFDDCFSVDNTQKIVKFTMKDTSTEVHFSVAFESEQYPFVQIYTPPTRESIAIEPMTCIPDAFNNKKGLIELQPQEKRSFSFSIEKE